jgi:hypothetical protein
VSCETHAEGCHTIFVELLKVYLLCILLAIKFFIGGLISNIISQV